MADNKDTLPDGLSDAEKAYFESGGENTDGLMAESDAPAEEAQPEPQPEKQAKPEPKEVKAEEEEDDDPRAKDPKSTVSYQKYKRDRQKLQDQLAAARKERTDEIEALKKQLGETNERFARGDERLRLLTEAMSQPQVEANQEEDPEPDPNEDVIGHAQWSKRELARLRQEMAEMRDGVHHTQGQIAERDADAQMRDSYQRDAMAFARETPDFGQAYNHLMNARAQMLEDQGYGQNEIRQILFDEERGLVARAVERGQRPAAAIYAIAKRMGYQTPQPAVNGNGANPPARAPSVTEEIERIAKGQAANRSLSDAGGGAASELSIEALANMSDREFQALYNSKKGNIEALMGKPH